MELTVSIEPLSAIMINLPVWLFSFPKKPFTKQQRYRVLTLPYPCFWAPPIEVVFI
jgi:hypothetical protein